MINTIEDVISWIQEEARVYSDVFETNIDVESPEPDYPYCSIKVYSGENEVKFQISLEDNYMAGYLNERFGYCGRDLSDGECSRGMVDLIFSDAMFDGNLGV